MVHDSTVRLQYLCREIPALLQAVSESDFSHKPSVEKWSKKEILGHLIDSAANNHHRFIRGRFEDYVVEPYHQNNWVVYNHYQQMPVKELISFWAAYNNYLVRLFEQIPVHDFKRIYKMQDGSSVTLEYLMEDYVSHMEHHLRQIISYDR